MDDFTIARVLHVLAVSMWMGGVAFVTTIVMPFIRRSSPPAARLEAFHHFEGRVAPQTRFWVLLAGASGFWMTWRDRKSVVWGTSVSVRVDLGGRRIMKKKNRRDITRRTSNSHNH